MGRISPVKNYEVLIKALGLLKERGVDFELALVGEPVLKGEEQYLKKLKDMIKAEGLESGVHFLGRIDHDQLPALYNQYDLFAHMSRTGSLDKTILEAMACGLSVVSSNDAAKSFLPAEYYFNDNDASGLAQAIEYASKNPINLREYVIENHNLDRLIDKIITLL